MSSFAPSKMAVVRDSAGLIRHLEEAYPISTKLGNNLLFEAHNIVILLSRDWLFREQCYLNVHVKKTIPRNAIPEFLWEHTKRGGGFTSGMFTPSRSH
jgi:hypothetical protein